MRLTSPDVKSLLEHGQRQSAGVQQVTVSARTLSNANLVLHGRGRVSDPQNVSKQNGKISKLAIAVPKRLLKRAVDRNRAKRVVREAFRLHPVRTESVSTLITLTQAPKSNSQYRRRFMLMLSLSANALLKKVTAKQNSLFTGIAVKSPADMPQIGPNQKPPQNLNQKGDQ
jgi:ribonuclease P protein component